MDNLRGARREARATLARGQFDHVWMIDFKKSGRASLDDVPQKLLDGDR
jgi:hypothetical protein